VEWRRTRADQNTEKNRTIIITNTTTAKKKKKPNTRLSLKKEKQNFNKTSGEVWLFTSLSENIGAK
jgi:hypothetical protein